MNVETWSRGMSVERWREKIVVELPQALQQRREVLEQRKDQFKREITREIGVKREMIADQVRQRSVGRVLGLSAEVLGTLGERIQEVHGRSPVQWDKIDQGATLLNERAEALAERRAQLERPAVERYDELNVSQVARALDTLSRYELMKLRDYERAHKNRVTVLREVERRLNAD
jgi:hypothetical protein